MEMKIAALVLTVLFGVGSALPGGAPAPACANIAPNPDLHGAQPSTGDNPYYLNISSLPTTPSEEGYGYQPGQSYLLGIFAMDERDFRGILVQARQVADSSPVGRFTVIDDNTKLSACMPPESAVTHTSRSDKMSVYLSWTAPAANTGPVRFQWSVVEVQQTYWSGLFSSNIYELDADGNPVTTEGPSGGAITLSAGFVMVIVSTILGVLM